MLWRVGIECWFKLRVGKRFGRARANRKTAWRPSGNQVRPIARFDGRNCRSGRCKRSFGCFGLRLAISRHRGRHALHAQHHHGLTIGCALSRDAEAIRKKCVALGIALRPPSLEARRIKLKVSFIAASSFLGSAEPSYIFASDGEERAVDFVLPTRVATVTITGSTVALYSDPSLLENLRLKERFRQFASEWRQNRNPLSSTAWDNVATPSYQRIIGMGDKAIPFILEEIQAELKSGEPDDWFVALWAISGENPVPEESRGNLKQMANAWLEWGARRGYVDAKSVGARVSILGRLRMP